MELDYAEPELWALPRRQAQRLWLRVGRRFDGNTTDDVTSWMVPLDGADDLGPRSLSMLLRMACEDDDLGWVVLPVLSSLAK